MQTLLSLYNQALSAVGAAANITNPSGTGQPVDICNLWYPVARQAVFTAAHWPSLRVSFRLALVKERVEGSTWTNDDPAPDYRYAFSLPPDMASPQYLQDFTRFELGRIGAQKVLFCNTLDPILHYTIDDPVPTNWELDLYRCVLWSLAACINMSKSGKMEVTQKLENQVIGLIGKAAETAANSDDTYYEAIPTLWAGTGFSVPQVQTQFIYPTQTFRVSASV
jgi:hypothetical protein